MAHSNVYALQIIAPDGRPALTWPAGHPIEVALSEAIVAALVHRITEPIVAAALARIGAPLMDEAAQQGVGFFKTEAQVEAAVHAAIASPAVAAELAAAIDTPAVAQAVRQTIADAILNLKRQVKPGRPTFTELTAD